MRSEMSVQSENSEMTNGKMKTREEKKSGIKNVNCGKTF